MVHAEVPPEPRPSLRGRDLLLILGLALVSLQLVGLLALPFLLGLDPATRDLPLLRIVVILLVFALNGVSLVAIVYLVARRWRGLSWAELGLRPATPNWYLRAGMLAVLAQPLTGLVNWITHMILGEFPENPQLSLIAPIGFSWVSLFGMLLVVGVLIPFAEELLFRGVLYRWLRGRWNVAVAAVASALCFAVLHGVPWLIPALAVLGVMLALVYERSGSLWPAVVTHGLYNSITVVILYASLASGIDPADL